MSVSVRNATRLGVSLLLSACSHHDASPTRAPNADSAAAAKAEEGVAAQTDEWNRAEIVKRLGEAGLVITDRARVVHHAGLTLAGSLLTASGSPLEIYIYPTAEARKKDSATLDTLPNPVEPPAQRPRFIISGNLIAIHVTPREVLAERVENVLTARHTDAP
jgi:lambda repressor-like predicted transcriptional regulator